MDTKVDNRTLWNNALAEIELSVSKANFTTWFKDTFIIKNNDGTVVIGVPNTFVKDWLNNKFHKSILKVLRDQIDSIKSIDYVVAKVDKSPAKEVKVDIRAQNNNALPLSDFYINKEDNLNPKYTFENFIIGPFNELAHAASQAIIKQPGIVYNPLFIYGNTGHGKTHLIQSIGNYIKSNFPNMKVFYLTSERFASEFISSMQTNKIENFKNKYRKYDVLIMDDIQFFSKKEKMQEELFHLFNTLYDNNKQIIFSSDKHPNYIQNLEDRLKSRFNQGMIVDIPKPDHESRVEILKRKSSLTNLDLNIEIIEYLAGIIDGNIRELEGIINSISCQSQLKCKNLSLNEIKELIKNSAEPKKMISIKDLIKIVADFYNIDPDTICDKTRRKEVVKPRQITMYILREDFNTSYPTIGDKLGGRDHTTVIHSCEKIKRELKSDPSLGQQLDQIRSMI
ncbi:MAG: chromosomal replication initiator protein [Candidatus Paceibacteria bacterium]|jgi:chromosomal replication initiator protein